MPPHKKSRMDAEQYLKRHGWRGTGHSLDHTDRGIKKPLLIAHKQDQNGLGHKKAAHKTDDQWWMRAFDESLKNIGTGKESTLAQVRKQGINRGGLYGFFVQGEGLKGTIGDKSSSSSASTSRSASTERDEKEEKKRSKKRKAELETHRATLKKQRKEAKERDSATKARLKSKSKSKSKSSKSETSSESDEKPKSESRKRKRDQPSVSVASVIVVDDDAKAAATKVLTRINRDVKKESKKQEKAGKFGPAAAKDDREARAAREQLMRSAEKEIKMGMVADALEKGDLPNPWSHTRAQVLEKYDDIMQAYRKTPKDDQQKQKPDAVPEPMEDVVPTAEPSNPEVDAKIAKLSAEERKQYKERAREKGQSLGQYVLRRLEKKGEKKEAKKADGAVTKSIKIERKEVKVKGKKMRELSVTEVAVSA